VDVVRVVIIEVAKGSHWRNREYGGSPVLDLGSC
jgi:hypothetical protein